MAPAHTPGPWIARGKHSYWVQTPGAQGAVICHVHGNPERSEEQAAADAKLLAAAPDLLHALQLIDANAESVEWIRRIARAAIAATEIQP